MNQPTHLSDDVTHFGYREVPTHEKTHLVEDVFNAVAHKYNLMNDLMSFGMHRAWKKFMVAQSGVRAGQRVLDVASGTGDLAKAFAKIVGPHGKVTATDINESMLKQAEARLTDAGYLGRIEFIEADGENLPFLKHHFDCVTIAFGLRNMTNQKAALRSMMRVLKPGGKLLILEFSHPVLSFLKKIYDAYSFNIIPKLGELVLNDRASYQYLVESIRMHPKQETLKDMMIDAGLEEVTYFNLASGIVALHCGWKY
ncbi:MAG: bifunctional demethylmenaquinone methyltransferase/2-methoxy-6-polyprenyl-1,4-benzoquinol methylase [Gammaproteobacteria bacterium RIFCSPHIGHO2_12_FULL_42_10]|nr:MAG: bifunctional demethylmenaquinone methyltransferase/2-methoxy-6-polyprenyl-1,4-benzoquinol methylase [Gammaproteobacteria bacterium RIFCSPHIGHO2_12_FULL_42_10]